MKVYVVICYDCAASGGHRFRNVQVFNSLEKAKHFVAKAFELYDWAEIEEKEVG